MNSLEILLLSGAYLAFLFFVAWRSERGRRTLGDNGKALVYGLSLAVYCTSWTFFGAVGTAARTGWDYLPIYIGPSLAVTLLFPIWRRVALAAKRENTGSIADFLSARYGKSAGLGALVAGVALVGALPYIALQLRSLTMVVSLLSGASEAAQAAIMAAFAAVLAGFAILFGARRVDLTEHNPGLVRAIAVESVVKLSALLAAALYATWLLTGHAGAAHAAPALAPSLKEAPHVDLRFMTEILLSAAAVFCLPRQFHAAFVELESPSRMGPSRYLFPVYLALTCLAVIPLASEGLKLGGGGNPDLFVLALPFARHFKALTAFVYIGGFSAATAMVVVETVALSAMASNQLILPLLTRGWTGRARAEGVQGLIMAVRRASIVMVLFVATLYARALSHQENLASIGLMSFAAAAQLAPALAGAVFWRGAHARGALAGISTGFIVWAALLAAPQLMGPDAIYSQAVARSFQETFGLDVLTGGALTSLALNITVFVVFSLLSAPRAVDLIQARAFVSPTLGVSEGGVALSDEFERLRELVARFLGEEGARRGFDEAAKGLDRPPNTTGEVDAPLAMAAERMLAGAIGASSARGVIAEALAGGARRPRDVVRMLDSAAQAVQFNRELLQSTLDNLSQGVSVVDADLRLVAWNARYIQMFDLPLDFVHVGRPVADIIRYNALRGECGPGEVENHVERRLEHLSRRRPHAYERIRPNGDIIRSTGAPMPNGGYLTSYTDITELRKALNGLAEANERLEVRVAERTEALEAAKGLAEAATASKTRFLAAASHDLLQPLHAARLFLAALETDVEDRPGLRELVHNADQSIDSAHRLLRALLNLSKLEAGGVKPEVRDFPLAPLFRELEREFAPQAAVRGLTLRMVTPSLWLRSDHDLIRSVMQNLISNAIRYTESGSVLVGCRRAGGKYRLEVWDTGPGIPEDSRKTVFGEFTRLPGSGRGDGGVGLGLAIVQRVVELLGEAVELKSVVGRGTVFCVSVAPAELDRTSAPRVVAASLANIRGVKVLCIDNEPAILRGMAAVLQRLGAEVKTARNEEEALLFEGPFDLALVDYHLDRSVGLDLHAPLKGRVRRFVIVTADTSEAVALEAARVGAELVQKPIKPEVLKGLLSVG